MTTVRKHISIALIALVLVNTLASVLVIGSFYSNRQFFAENFCVNKAKPTLCMGSCHLTKVLKDFPDQQDEPVALKVTQLSFEFFAQSNEWNLSNNNLFDLSLKNTVYTIFYASIEVPINAPPPRVS